MALSCAAVRTLIVSDFHLGLRTGADVLRRPEPLQRLLAAIDGVERLVLLGDALELGASTARAPKPDAERVLRAIGERLGPERSVVVVPGNHDARLVRAWALSREGSLGIADEVPPDATPALAALTGWLAPARVRVSYPGVWLDDRVWATHGHYLDRHLIPESAFGLLRSAVAQAVGRESASTLRPARPIDYEWARRRAAARRRRTARRDGFATRLRQRPLGTLVQTAAELAREGAIPQIPRLMMRAGLTSATAQLADAQMRRSAVPAMAEVAQRLGVDADWIVFGHVHRLGPRDEPAWQPLAGGPRLLNTGAWLFEPMLVDQAAPPHPYWPGGAVLARARRRAEGDRAAGRPHAGAAERAASIRAAGGADRAQAVTTLRIDRAQAVATPRIDRAQALRDTRIDRAQALATLRIDRAAVSRRFGRRRSVFGRSRSAAGRRRRSATGDRRGPARAVAAGRNSTRLPTRARWPGHPGIPGGDGSGPREPWQITSARWRQNAKVGGAGHRARCRAAAGRSPVNLGAAARPWVGGFSSTIGEKPPTPTNR